VTDRPLLDPADVPIRPAATVMLIRDHAEGDGIEVFMLRRTLAAAFGSGMYVFPGGRVETHDGENVEHAHRLAAIRECFEEAGVLLATHRETGAHVVDGHPALAERHAIHDGSAELLALCEAHDLVPTIAEMAWVSHWITPIGEQRRFDTRFYLVPAPPEQTSVHDDNETIASLWVRPSEALARQAAGELTMMPPTIKNLTFLAGFGTVDEAMRVAVDMPPPPCILPKVQFVDGRIVGVLLPGEAGYDEL
jgi:8-oxo-dGTP pyrophosphatase MutT (NUDIX family)